MTRRPRQNHTPAFKAKVARAAGGGRDADEADRPPGRSSQARQIEPGRRSTYPPRNLLRQAEPPLQVAITAGSPAQCPPPETRIVLTCKLQLSR